MRTEPHDRNTADRAHGVASMNTQSDLDINRAVRRLMVKHWVDMGRISVRTTRGNISLFGMLQRIEGRMEPLNPAIVDALIYEMRRLPGVHQLRAHFDNWTNDGGRWRPQQPAHGLANRAEEGREGLSPASDAPGTGE